MTKTPAARPKTIHANWYDHPEYYDLAFSDDTEREVNFVEAACRKYCSFPVRTLLEPACGSGRVVAELANRGYNVTGIDLAAPALEFLRKRLARRKRSAQLIQGNMVDFTLPKPVDSAYCLLNSFRHLVTESDAQRHLQSVARALRPGGIYIIGLHLLPPDADDYSIERWKIKRGKTEIGVDLRVVASDRRKRVERIRVSLRAKTATKHWHLRDEFDLRLYSAAQAKRLFTSLPDLQLCDIYDFWYDIDDPLKLTNELSDTVFILRKSQ